MVSTLHEEGEVMLMHQAMRWQQKGSAPEAQQLQVHSSNNEIDTIVRLPVLLLSNHPLFHVSHCTSGLPYLTIRITLII
jgi:hypothetical protein